MTSKAPTSVRIVIGVAFMAILWLMSVLLSK